MTTERFAYEILQKVTRDGAFANLAVKEALSAKRPNDVGRSTALAYTAIERMNYCDFLIDSYAKGRIHSSIRCILRIGLTELFFMDTPDHAACNNAVKLTENIGKAKLKGFVNGVMRNVARDKANGGLPELPADPVKRLSILYGYPEFFIAEIIKHRSEDGAEALLAHEVKGVPIRAVPPMTTDGLIGHLASLGIDQRRSGLVDDCVISIDINGDISKDELFMKGLITVQSESAMLACRCLAPKPGSRVLDACAAPGGKTAYLLDLMERKGEVTAWDVHPHRVELIENTMKRLGIEGVKAEVRDASVPDPKLLGKFDSILLDVPCSGLGGASKPDARLRRTCEGVNELAKIQYSILPVCSKYLKTGGSLVYSTCTLSDRENELIIERFLNENPGFGLESLTPFLPDKLKERGASGMMRLYPDIDDTEGFFIAKLRRM